MPAPAINSESPAIHVRHATYKLQDISSWHLLGENPSLGDLPETNLQLTLQGVLTVSQSGVASAIIAQQGQSGKVYSPGDALPGGAMLAKVMADKVVIRNRGKLEVLPLVRAKLQFTPVTPSGIFAGGG
jgi:type II secretory pathway component PulC